MKRFALLMGMVVASLMTYGQNFYTIQVRSMSNEIALTDAEKDAGMWTHKQDGLTKYFLGRFDTYGEAKESLAPLKLSQYKDAFVVSSRKIKNLNPASVPPAPKADIQAVAKPKALQPTPYSKVDMFTVQIAAYRFPLYTKDFNLGDGVMEFYCSDNIYRYTIGKFADQTEARQYLATIKDSGYPDAFLIDYAKYEVYRIE